MDVWFISDTFLSKMFPTLQAMRTSATMANKAPPFVYNQFNVFFFFMSQATRISNVLTKLVNSAVEGFNRREYMPKYICMIIDEDMLFSLDYFQYGITYLLGVCFNWLARQVERLLEARAEDLFKKKPGAVFGETKIVWVKMFTRYGITPDDPRYKVHSKKYKFNAALDELVDKRLMTYVVSITSLEQCHFNKYGKLNYAGKIQFWRELDQHFERFERIELEQTIKQHARGCGDQPRCALPAPPKRERDRNRSTN